MRSSARDTLWVGCARHARRREKRRHQTRFEAFSGLKVRQGSSLLSPVRPIGGHLRRNDNRAEDMEVNTE